MPQTVKLIALGTTLSVLLATQDVKALLRNTARAMGAENLKSVEYSGSGLFYWFGQAANPSSPWPKFYAKSYRRIIDLSAGVPAQTVVRTQYENPPHGGGNQPVIGEDTLTQTVSTHDPWSRDDGIGYSAGLQLEIWISPVGFLKGATDHNATVAVKKISGTTYSVVSYKPENEYPVTYINERSMIEKVETRVDNALLGDMLIEASYAVSKFWRSKISYQDRRERGRLPTIRSDDYGCKEGCSGGYSASTSAEQQP